ncbi:unnamed protein product [Bubo scandiacus]
MPPEEQSIPPLHQNSAADPLLPSRSARASAPVAGSSEGAAALAPITSSQAPDRGNVTAGNRRAVFPREGRPTDRERPRSPFPARRRYLRPAAARP